MLDAQAHFDPIPRRADCPPPAFACSWSSGALDAGWVRVAGDLDMATAPQLERTLREPGLRTHLVVLDLRELAFMDSAGVRAIVDASVRARESGQRLVIVQGSSNVDRMFTLTGSAEAVEIIDVAALPTNSPGPG